MTSKILKYLIPCCMALLTACSSSPQKPDHQAAAPLRVGLSGDYPPFCITSADPAAWKGYQGFDLDLLQQLSRDLQLPEVQAVPFQWPNLSKTLKQHSVDLAICGITIRPDRAEAMLFTRPYAVSGAVVVLPQSQSTRFKTLASLNQAKVRLGVNQGGHLERVTRDRFQKATIQTTPNNLELHNLLTSGSVDAVVSDTIETATWQNVSLLGPFTHDRKAMALPLDQTELRYRIDEWLAAREQDGWLRQRRKLLGGQNALTPQQVCAEALSSSLSQRFSLMPQVAAAKQREGLPITDPVQESKVMQQALSTATKEGLPEPDTRQLFTVLMDLSKSIQNRDEHTAATGASLLELRKAVAGAGSALLPEVRRCRNTLANHPENLETTLRQDLGEWLNQEQIESLLNALPPRAFTSKQ